MTPRRALLTGHFSTVGDVEVLHQVQTRLDAVGMPYAVTPFSQHRVESDPSWVPADALDPSEFTHLFVICGPYAPDYPAEYPWIFGRFRHCTQIGVNLTMVAPLESCNPFDALIERDSDRSVRPDLSFLTDAPRVPVVGLCLVQSQREYGDRQQHDVAARRLRDVIRSTGAAIVELDTALPRSMNHAGIGTPEEFESICARLDAVVTTRLHGTVLALKCGVPVVAVDAIRGGDKVTRQTRLLGWPESYVLDETPDETLAGALRRCLTPDMRQSARTCAAGARDMLADYDAAFLATLDAAADPSRRPPMPPRRGWPSRLAARYRRWKRRWIPSRRAGMGPDAHS